MRSVPSRKTCLCLAPNAARAPAVLAAVTLALLGTSAAALAACGAGGEAGTRVVATTTHVAELARSVAGERAAVIGLLPPNSDPHDHEPRPSDVEAVAAADLILRSGGDLDLWAEAVIDASGSDAEVVELIDAVETIPAGEAGGHGEAEGDAGEGGEPDPHWWQSPANAVLAVEAIRDRLVDVDPGARTEYEANARRYVERLEALDRAIAGCMEAIPAPQRKLVTGHDSFAYFTDRYDIEVVGAAIPALSTQTQPSAGETAELVELIRDEGVAAVFAEAGLSDRIAQALASETGARVGGTLWADTLGPEGSGAETYIGAIAANARTITAGLTGDDRSCAGLSGRAPRSDR